MLPFVVPGLEVVHAAAVYRTRCALGRSVFETDHPFCGVGRHCVQFDPSRVVDLELAAEHRLEDARDRTRIDRRAIVEVQEDLLLVGVRFVVEVAAFLEVIVIIFVIEDERQHLPLDDELLDVFFENPQYGLQLVDRFPDEKYEQEHGYSS